VCERMKGWTAFVWFMARTIGGGGEASANEVNEHFVCQTRGFVDQAPRRAQRCQSYGY
jgi:hypothetical protein